MAPTFRKLLVPIDFSSVSKTVLVHARALSERFGGSLHLIHAWDLPPPLRPDLMVWAGDVKGTLMEATQHEAAKAMQAFLAETGLAGNPSVTTAIVQGAPGACILQAAEAGGFDAIVMGTHGRTGLSHLVLGSVAERVVRYAKCPVVTIRAVTEPG